MTYYAHSFDSDCRDNWQTLDEHLAKVSQRAASFLSPLKAESWGRAAGLIHDVGKACPEFQRRLQGSAERGPFYGRFRSSAYMLSRMSW